MNNLAPTGLLYLEVLNNKNLIRFVMVKGTAGLPM
jgi:hypothetical protein